MIKTTEIEPQTNGDPFQNCALGRKQYALVLTDILSYYANEGGVIAINGRWGAGKTTFVKMWKQLLNQNQFQTLYFNAWENDFTQDPLVALISELKEVINNDTAFDKIAPAFGRVLISVGTSIGKQVLEKATGVKYDTLEAAIDECSEIGKEELKQYSELKASIDDFRKKLIEFIASNAGEKPVVFFIDELDRCTPTYAVLLLERIKHLFNIPNLVFVLSINSEQLQYSIQGHYGSSSFDAKGYLKRFIDIEYSLPDPDIKHFCNYLYDKYEISHFFGHKQRIQHREFEKEGDAFLEIVRSVVSSKKVTLRDLEQMFIYIRIALNGFAPNNMTIPSVFFLLIYWKFTDNILYQAIRSHQFNSERLLEEIEKYTPSIVNINGIKEEPRSFIFAIAQLITYYNLNDSLDPIENLFIKNKETNESLSIFQPKKFTKKTFDDALDCYQRDFNRSHITINYFIQRIELMNHLTIYE